MRRLSVDKEIVYIFAAVLSVASVIVVLLPTKLILWSAAILLTASAIFVHLFIKKRSILSYNKRQVLLLMTVIAALFLMLYYLSGLYFGFGGLRVRFEFKIVYNYIIPIAIIIFLVEFIRSVLLMQGSTVVSIITYFVCVLAEFTIAGGVSGITSAYTLADFIGMTLFPAITANFLYHYVSKRYGMLPNVVYRLILTLYYYVVLVIPNAPQILLAFAFMLLPIFTFLFLSVLYEKKRKMATHRKSRFGVVISCVLFVVMIGFVMLVSCQFRYGIIVIASESMTDEISRGDAVVYETYENIDKIEENDVIIFDKTGRMRTVHRVVAINTINGQRQYITKGDANEDIDSGYVTDDQIIGVVHFKVLYIGYPSLWLRELFN